MESKQPTKQQPQSKTNHPTVLGAIFFTIFNLILLSMLSWILLETWFTVQIIFLDIRGLNQTIQKILTNNLNIINHYHSLYSDIALNNLHLIQNTLHSWFNGHISGKLEEIFIGITGVVLTRLCVFIEFMPFMVLILFVLTIDGLVQRDKRKFQGSRESTFLFHRLKPLAKLSFFSLFFIYMVIPFMVLPELFLVPMVVLSSLFTMLTIKSFKKYL